MKIKGEKKKRTQAAKSAQRSCSQRCTSEMRVLHSGRGRERESIFHCMRRRTSRTFGDFDSFDRLIVYGTGTLFDEPITFDTEIEDVCALHG